MNNKQQFFLRSPQIRNNAVAMLNNLQEFDEKRPLVCEIKPMTRTLDQNAKLHAMLTDISRQMLFNNERLSVEDWKAIMVSAHAKATGQEERLVTGLEGELVNLRESTAQMGVKRLASLIEYITAWGVANGVHFNDRANFWGWK